MICKVARLAEHPPGNGSWDGPAWRDIPAELLQNYMGAKPDHFPRTEVKMAYDKRAIHLMFKVRDRYVRAVAAEHQDKVWEDSCVEFFFTPDVDPAKGYFNLEMNCGGTMLFHFQPGAGQDRIVIPKSECAKIVCTHSLPRIIEPEIDKPVTWTIAYSIPIALLRNYGPVIAPAAKVVWRANFYKCGDKTSHPHWLTWAPVDYPKPNFHRPQSFGRLVFE